MKMVAGWSSGGRGVEGRGERERERGSGSETMTKKAKNYTAAQSK